MYCNHMWALVRYFYLDNCSPRLCLHAVTFNIFLAVNFQRIRNFLKGILLIIKVLEKVIVYLM